MEREGAEDSGPRFVHVGEVALPRTMPPSRATGPSPAATPPTHERMHGARQARPKPSRRRRRLRRTTLHVAMLLFASGLVVAGAAYKLHQWSSLDAKRTRTSARPTDRALEARPGSSSNETVSPACPHGFELEGHWLLTTTVVGSTGRMEDVSGRYVFDFALKDCKPWVTIQKTGYEATELQPQAVQRGNAPVVPAGKWGDLSVSEVSVTLARENGDAAIERVFRFIRVGEHGLVGEWHQRDDAWQAHGMWGHLGAERGSASYPRPGTRAALPCLLQCRVGCDALRREMDALPPHEQLDPCLAACASSRPNEALCVPDDGFSSFTESIGELRLEMTVSEARAALGAPSSASEPVFEWATGATVQTWSYPHEGVSLEISSDRRVPVHLGHPSEARLMGFGTVTAIMVSAPSERRTSRGIGIGTATRAVEHAYGPSLDAELTTTDRLVMGSDVSELVFEVQNERVRSIYLGADAQ